MHSLGSGDPPTEIPDVASMDLSYDEVADGEVIGRGGNADVFRVTVERGGREIPVAVKQPRLQGTLDTDTVERFVQEADVWAELDGHEHIVSLYDWGAEPLPWLAMEYMDRGTLADVPDGERLPLEQALWVGVCVCRAVHHAHRFGVAHHDIKPANVLFTSTDDGWAAPKVSDWGLARLMLDETGSVAEFSPGYAAPEQFDAEEYGSPDDRTDIYQVGTLVYELVTGQPPFEGSATAVMQGVLSTEPTPPSEVADVPTGLDDVLGEALAKEPAERYESILYLRDRLQELFDALDEQQSSSDDDAGGMTADSRSVTETKGGTTNEGTEDHALTGSADADEETEEHALTALAGVDERTAESLAVAGYESVEHIAAADQKDLQEVDNVSIALAGRMKAETAGVDVSDEIETAVSKLGDDTETTTTEPIESVDEETDNDEVTKIEDISGVGETTAEALREAGYNSPEHIRGASQDELANVDGIGVALAAHIKGDVVDTTVGWAIEKGEFHCPECEFSTAVESSYLREGDFCPECRRSLLEHHDEGGA
jgi:serine/threonine protein kinase